MNNNPNLVAWRKQHGSMCHICPLNGQRKVGCDGPTKAEHIGVGDFPSRQDAEMGVTRGERYGRAFSDKVGYFMKLEHAALNPSIVTLRRQPGHKWPTLTLSNLFLVNLLMCTIPGKKKPAIRIKSPVGKAALLCCSNSYLALMRALLHENLDRTLLPMGNDALSATMRAKLSIDSYRGRVPAPLMREDVDRIFAPIPEATIYAKVLRGKKPWTMPKATITEPEWNAIEWFLKEIIKLQRAGVRKVAKHGLTAPPEFTEMAVCGSPLTGVVWRANHSVVLDILLKKQLVALRKRAKKEKDSVVVSVLEQHNVA